MTLEFSRQIFRKTQISSFVKIRPVGAELFHVDRHDEANSGFSQFCERAYKQISIISPAAVNSKGTGPYRVPFDVI
jgi:hypothetical protein